MGKVALITGCSSGIGHATAKEFALKGYKVIAAARRLEPMEDLISYGVKIVSLDVTSQQSVAEMKKLIEIEYNGQLDILFNNAGQPCSFPAIDVTDDQVKQCYEVNVFGPIRLTRELIPFLIDSKGTVGFTGSVSGLIPFPFSSIYSSTKAAIHAFASTLAFELEPFGVKVNNFITGGVATNIADKRSSNEGSYYAVEGIEELLDRRRAMAARNNPMLAEEYARRIIYDFEHLKIGKVDYYRGSKATIIGILQYLPRFIIIRGLIRFFGMQKVFSVIRKLYAKGTNKT